MHSYVEIYQIRPRIRHSRIECVLRIEMERKSFLYLTPKLERACSAHHKILKTLGSCLQGGRKKNGTEKGIG